MDAFVIAAAMFAGGMLYKLREPYKYIIHQNLEGNHARVVNQPVPTDIARQAGNDLFRSGHPDEVVLRSNLKIQNLAQVQGKLAKDLKKNESLMTSDHFNNQLSKRKTYASVNSEIGYPSLNMASGWYAKTVATQKKHQPNYVRTF